jgi:hypothetical protein
MSTTPRPAILPLKLPRAAPGSVPKASSFDDAMQQLERADAQNVKQGTTPNLPALILTAANGSSWRVNVSDDGTLYATLVGR